MIIFINGAFGAGKSTVAKKLNRKLKNSLIFDPEEVGFMLRKIYRTVNSPDNFQDLQAWRKLVTQTAKALMEQYNKTLIIPICMSNIEYFEEVTRELKTIDKNFYHFCLIAKKQTILTRLSKRKNKKAVEWAKKRLDDCLKTFKSSDFETKILTSNITIDQITERIYKKLNCQQLQKAVHATKKSRI